MDADLLAFAHTLADAAGDVIRPYFESELTVEDKADKTPVTKADREAEAAMRALIDRHYPTHEIFGEEFGITLAATNDASRASEPPRGQQTEPAVSRDKEASRASEPSASGATRKLGQETKLEQPKNYTWVLDPIDGTRAFIAGRKEWGTLIALCEDGVPVLGMLDQPATGERWWGVVGEPTIYKGNSVRTRACTSLAEAEFSTTSLNFFTPEQASRVVKLAQACKTTVRDGDCYAYGLLARGVRDVVIDAGLKPYDILALVPIINGANGKITAWDGKPITLTHFSTALAVGDASLHEEVKHILF